MNDENLVAQHYLQTQILGAYETANIIWQSDSEGDLHRTFQDSFVNTDEAHHTVERNMVVEGKLFRVHSIFPVTAMSNPTKKLLTAVENDCEKTLKGA